MALEAALVSGYGVEDTRNAVRDVVAHQIVHIEACKNDADSGKENVKIVALVDVDMAKQHAREQVDEHFQHNGSKAAERADHEGQEEHESTLLDVFLAPSHQAQKRFVYLAVRILFFHRFTFFTLVPKSHIPLPVSTVLTV